MCGTDAEQTLHSRCVDVKASGRRYTVIKNSVIACGLFLPHSLLLLVLFSLSEHRSLAPLLPSFRHQNPCSDASFSHVNQPQARSPPLYSPLTNLTLASTFRKTKKVSDMCTYFHNTYLPKLGARNRGHLHPPWADSRCDWIAYRGKNPHFLVIFLSFPPSLSQSAP